MRKWVASLAIVGAAVIASQASAETNADQDPNKVICKKIYPTGSRTRVTKVCATKAQWDAEANSSSRSVKNMQSRAGVGGGGSTNPMAPAGQ
jgi:hypothetical protein